MGTCGCMQTPAMAESTCWAVPCNGRIRRKRACRLDLGQVAYAVNGMVDPNGRVLVWAWLQENGRLKEDEYSYSGCLTLPRELSIRSGPHG